jgi:lipopolysaccharide biosynthesis glycosyltransferase
MTLPRQTVIYAADASFWEHTYVSLYSLLVNNQDVSFDVRILSAEPDKRFFDNLACLRNVHSNAEISWLPVDDCLLADAPLSISYITKATYYRLILARILPEDVQRVLYIDGDTIIRRSLRELFSMDVEDYVLAAAPEYDNISHNQRLGMPEGLPCFNAGVLLINLAKWRSQHIEERCFEFIRNNASDPSKLKYNDQDALNAVLPRQWKSFGPDYNFSPWALHPKRLVDFDVHSQLGGVVAADGPAIAHYAGKVKPWHGGSLHPFESDYWHYRMQTPYASRRKLIRSKLALWNGLAGVRVELRRAAATVLRRLPFGNSVLRVARYMLRAT